MEVNFRLHKIRTNSPLRIYCKLIELHIKINAPSFCWSKMILDHPNLFGPDETFCSWVKKQNSEMEAIF